METSKTNKVQFSKWVAKFDESVEDFAAELKRLYGKAHLFLENSGKSKIIIPQTILLECQLLHLTKKRRTFCENIFLQGKYW